jgi:hypothetical protein
MSKHFKDTAYPIDQFLIYYYFFFNSARYIFSFTENAYEISIVASKEIIDNDFIPLLNMSQCHDMRSSNDIFRVLQVDDEGGQGKIYLCLSINNIDS